MERIKFALEALASCNAKDIKVYDFKGKNSLYDYSIVATCTSTRQVNALYSKMSEIAYNNNFEIRNVCGKNTGWLIIDYLDIMVHFFSLEERNRFDSDKIYSGFDEICIDNIK